MEVLLNEAKKRMANGKGKAAPRVKEKDTKALAKAKQVVQESLQWDDIMKATQLQYHYVAPIEDAVVASVVLTWSLDQNITLSHRELLALALEVQKQMKELTTVKHLTTGGAHFSNMQSTQPTMQLMLSGQKWVSG